MKIKVPPKVHGATPLCGPRAICAHDAPLMDEDSAVARG